MPSTNIIFSLPFTSWACINLFVGLYEVYAFINKDKLKLEKQTLWEKMEKGDIDITNFWIEGWSEYSKVDSRYIYKHYVWGFEVLNAIIAFLFIFGIILEKKTFIYVLLVISMINCGLYFASLILENIYCQNKNQYARIWQFPIYYLISGIWLIVPYYLLSIIY